MLPQIDPSEWSDYLPLCWFVLRCVSVLPSSARLRRPGDRFLISLRQPGAQVRRSGDRFLISLRQPGAQVRRSGDRFLISLRQRYVPFPLDEDRFPLNGDQTPRRKRGIAGKYPQGLQVHSWTDRGCR
ncbi:hypothetical protein GQR42_00865 [Microcystis aeruginosa FD4]|uniref:Uncharacterized protein n=1 Tax=Microcystis aeruginosa FD4 TaxID=2686288 RepID=A0A857D9I4_MICAE|nr:hypothetical protein GQR42_00865 [Microcystis aeruginosa FD4]